MAGMEILIRGILTYKRGGNRKKTAITGPERHFG